MNIIDAGVSLAAVAAGSDWRDTWPFGPGWAEGWVSSILKFGLIAVIFLAIAGLLRFLFGPGGFMRDKEFDLPPEASDQAAQPGREGQRPQAAGPGDPEGTHCSKKVDAPHA